MTEETIQPPQEATIKRKTPNTTAFTKRTSVRIPLGIFERIKNGNVSENIIRALFKVYGEDTKVYQQKQQPTNKQEEPQQPPQQPIKPSRWATFY